MDPVYRMLFPFKNDLKFYKKLNIIDWKQDDREDLNQ